MNLLELEIKTNRSKKPRLSNFYNQEYLIRKRINSGGFTNFLNRFCILEIVFGIINKKIEPKNTN